MYHPTHDVEVVGILHGYENLEKYAVDRPMQVGHDYLEIDQKVLRRTRNTQGVMIGTSRSNPGRKISAPDHFDDPECVGPLRNVYEALCSMQIDALISIGGDDTLKTANKLKMYQDRLSDDAHRIPVVHLPKTIDNDYWGIDFTFGYFTAVDTLASEIRNLLFDSEASRAYFLAETMGRSAGWLAYGAAIAGEASLVISVEDILGDFEERESFWDEDAGKQVDRKVMNMERVISHMVDMMQVREKENKEFGVFVIAEGLAELLPMKYLEGIPRDEHGHISISHVNLGRMFAALVSERYTKRTGRKRKVTGLQLGYESRCAKPHAFDVMLGSQLGVGAFRALVEEQLDGVMVSVSGQLELHYVPFADLVDQTTLVTKVRYIEPGSDFHRLARFMETHLHGLGEKDEEASTKDEVRSTKKEIRRTKDS